MLGELEEMGETSFSTVRRAVNVKGQFSEILAVLDCVDDDRSCVGTVSEFGYEGKCRRIPNPWRLKLATSMSAEKSPFPLISNEESWTRNFPLIGRAAEEERRETSQRDWMRLSPREIPEIVIPTMRDPSCAVKFDFVFKTEMSSDEGEVVEKRALLEAILLTWNKATIVEGSFHVRIEEGTLDVVDRSDTTFLAEAKEINPNSVILLTTQ